ncbi:hypothetical protein TNCV_3460001 [Trichonephila clavipes]|nr:hypothetical protein TNCV_3460001 [Trichonephila clavipes]
MKTSSVEFISQSPTPSPMNSNYRRFVLPDESFNPGSGSEGKREIVLNRRPELYRGKYRCSTKDQLVEKDVLMPGEKTQCFPVEPSGCRRGAST